MNESIQPKIAESEFKRFLMRVLAKSAIHPDVVNTRLDSVAMHNAMSQEEAFVDDLAKCLVNSFSKFSQPVINTPPKHVNQKVDSNYGYYSGYKKPRSVAEQIKILKECFPNELKNCFAKADVVENQIPDGAEGWFVKPRWQLFDSNYFGAFTKALSVLIQIHNGNFSNIREDKLKPNHVHPSLQTAFFSEKLEQDQKGYDFLIFPAQFGVKYSGCSGNYVNEDISNSSEYCLDAFTVIIMLITHKERLQHRDDLNIDCFGDVVSMEDGGAFTHSPCFSFDGHWLKFGVSKLSDAVNNYGAVTGFYVKS